MSNDNWTGYVEFEGKQVPLILNSFKVTTTTIIGEGTIQSSQFQLEGTVAGTKVIFYQKFKKAKNNATYRG